MVQALLHPSNELLSKSMSESLSSYAQVFCAHQPDSWQVVSKVGSGNSATVYHVRGDQQEAALKVYNPRFFQGRNAAVETRRINDQIALRGHGHPNLIDFFSTTQAHGTHFLLMEYLPWPTLAQCLTTIDRDEIPRIIAKIASAAKFLEDKGLVHRDIKPSNILISEDFGGVKLLDLGVMRPISTTGTSEATDHGPELPFVATAQYSSPAYLFRDNQPTERMWRALTFYQLGAVLHDLIMSRPIFEKDVRSGNKYLVAAAVLSVSPKVYAPDVPSWIIALTRNCLVKRDDHRLKRVAWESFDPNQPTDLEMIRRRLGLAERAIRSGGISKPPIFEYIKVRLDEIVQMMRTDCIHVLRREGFPNVEFKHGPSDERSRTIMFSFIPDPEYPEIWFSFILKMALQEGSDDEISIFLASFVYATEARIFPRDIDFMVWPTSLAALAPEREKIMELLTSEFIRRFDIALVEIPSFVEGVACNPILEVKIE